MSIRSLPWIVTLLVLVLLGSLGGVRGHGDESHQPSLEQPESTSLDSGRRTGHAATGSSPESRAEDQGDEKGFFTRLLPGFSQAEDLHPMFVHFPIAFLVAALFFVCLSWWRDPDRFVRLTEWMLVLGAITLPVAALSGFVAFGGWGSGHVTPHRNLMLITTVLTLGLAGVVFWKNRVGSYLESVVGDEWYRWGLTIGLFVITVFLVLGADRGAWLVFVEGSGVRSTTHYHAPEQKPSTGTKKGVGSTGHDHSAHEH